MKIVVTHPYTSNGFPPTSDGLQPTSDAMKVLIVCKSFFPSLSSCQEVTMFCVHCQCWCLLMSRYVFMSTRLLSVQWQCPFGLPATIIEVNYRFVQELSFLSKCVNMFSFQRFSVPSQSLPSPVSDSFSCLFGLRLVIQQVPAACCFSQIQPISN